MLLCFLKGNSLFVFLPDGREANATTEAGANDILPHLGKLIVQMAVQARLGKITDDELLVYYTVFQKVAKYCSPEAFQTHLTPKQLDCLIGHLVENFQQIARDPTWIQAGEMKRHHQRLLVIPVTYFMHQNFVKRVLVSAFFPAFAEIFAALQSPVLCKVHQYVIDNMLLTVYNLFCNKDDFKNNMQLLEATGVDDMQLLEATGVLGQFIRLCAFTDHEYQSAVVWVLGLVSQCTVLLEKKFKSGKACGDILNSSLSGEDGYSGKRNEAVLSQLLNLQKLATMAEKKDFPSGNGAVCGNCNKGLTSDDTFFRCARCVDADYCSKECQKADWKCHKKYCTLIDDKGLQKAQFKANEAQLKANENNNRIFMSWVITHCRMITDQMENATKKESVNMQDLMIEVDFCLEDGMPLALKDPPEFKIGVTRNYLEGKSPLPNWFNSCKKKAVLAWLKEECNKLAMNKEKKESRCAPVLFLILLPDGSKHIRQVDWSNNMITHTMFSDLGLGSEFDKLDDYDDDDDDEN
jgi:hypothetical protein